MARSLKKIRGIYAQAEAELKRKLRSFRLRHAAKQKQMMQDLKDGKISKADYESWMRGQVFIGDRWKAKIAQAARIFGKATVEARDIIQRFRIHVWSENYNRYAYETEIQTGISFDIYNEDAVNRLIEEDPQLLPKWKIDEQKDYIWNQQKVENAVTQGIIQGESVDQITDRIARDLNTTNTAKMRMFARTAMNGAQNAARQKQFEDAVAKGINIEKQWMATLDNRTRDTHQRLDGQTVPVEHSFAVDTKQIRYPGDPSASPELVYNCRCTMRAVFKGINDRNWERRAYKESKDGHRESYIVKDMTYLEWKKWKEGQNWTR